MIEDLIDRDGESFYLLTSTKTNDGVGGKSETWAAGSASYKGIKNFLSGNKRIINAANNYLVQIKVYCYSNVPVLITNKLRFADGDYAIMQIDTKGGHHKEIIAGKN